MERDILSTSSKIVEKIGAPTRRGGWGESHRSPDVGRMRIIVLNCGHLSILKRAGTQNKYVGAPHR